MNSAINVQPRASVVIITRARKDDVRRALISCFEQDVELEVLVFLDASTDGTFEMISSEFPKVRVFREYKRVGYIVLRNRGFREARSPFVFSIDDDAWFSHPSTIREALEAFEKDDKIAALALRYIEPTRRTPQGFMRELQDYADVRNFVGCAHAVRISAVLDLGGYREFLLQQGEERDLCIRLLARGYSTKYLITSPVIHEPSNVREHSKFAYFGHRNTLLFDILNVPLPSLLWRLPADIVLLLKHRITLRTLPLRMVNTIRSLAACVWFLPKRSPVSATTYSKYCQLPSHGPVDPKTLSRTENLENRGYRQGG